MTIRMTSNTSPSFHFPALHDVYSMLTFWSWPDKELHEESVQCDDDDDGDDGDGDDDDDVDNYGCEEWRYYERGNDTDVKTCLKPVR